MARNKFFAKKVTDSGCTFDSLAEHRRFCELKLLERAGKIRSIEVHPVLQIKVNGTMICKFIPDFAYFEDNLRVYEDCKSTPTNTPVSKLKQKLVRALYPGIELRLIGLP